MLFPKAAVAPPAELPAGVFADPAMAGGSTVTGAGDPADGGTAAETVFGSSDAALGCALADAGEAGLEEDGPPRLIT